MHMREMSLSPRETEDTTSKIYKIWYVYCCCSEVFFLEFININTLFMKMFLKRWENKKTAGT